MIQDDKILSALQKVCAHEKQIPQVIGLDPCTLKLTPIDSSIPSYFLVKLEDENQDNCCKSFINHQIIDLHVDFYSELSENQFNQGNLQNTIWQEMCEMDSSYVQMNLGDSENERLMTKVAKNRITESDLDLMNPFTSCFKYDVLTNEYLQTEGTMVEDMSYKNFNEESNNMIAYHQTAQQNQAAVDKISINDNQQNPNQENTSMPQNSGLIHKEIDLEKEFLEIGQEVEKYFTDVKNTKIKSSRNLSDISDDYYDTKQLQQLLRVVDVFDRERHRNGQARQSEKINKLSILNDSESIFKNIKEEWEKEKQLEEQKEIDQTALMDFDSMLLKVEQRIQYKEQLEVFQEQELLKQQLQGKVDLDNLDDLEFDKIEQKQSIFKNIKLQDNNELIEKKLQLSTSYEWATEDTFDLNLIDQIIPKDKMAMKYPFNLDGFQKRSVYRMENKESVFVCAHTSAGKTVVAEYAIALAKKMRRKVIYTSPIKALSNQKYRDFKDKFGDDVGILTGDVTLNPTASCLIVTTEILRIMLYKGHNIIRDIDWVIFDEVHYVNNQDRGVVWEETIILLPETIGIVMLSATVRNYMDFANWVGRTKKRKIYVQKTNYRPVPLEHSIFLFDKMHVVKSGEGNFEVSEYDGLIKMINTAIVQKGMITSMKKELKLEKKQKGNFKNTNQSMKNKKTMKQITEKFIKQISEDELNKQNATPEINALRNLLIKCSNEDLLPCVVFIFSKKRIQEIAANLGPVSFVEFEEMKKIDFYFRRAARKFNQRDLNVPQIQTVKDLLLRGIAIHHSDVIPFVKEIVELLFSEGLVKVLLATETFAMGINMPTKTVIFHTIKKYDAQGLRLLSSSEYTQMSGRAGRRGLDSKGNVIIFVPGYESLPTKKDLTAVLDHRGEMLESKFKLSYETILNLVNSKVHSVMNLMKQSYQENEKYANLPGNIRRFKELKSQYSQLRQYTCTKVPPALDLSLPIDKYLKTAYSMSNYSKLYFNQVKVYIQDKMALPFFCVVLDNKFRLYLGLVIEIDQSGTRFLNFLHIEKMDCLHQPIFRFAEDEHFFNIVENHNYYDPATQQQYNYKIFKLSLEQVVRIYEDDPKVAYGGGIYDPIYLGNCIAALIKKQESFREHFISDQQAKTRMKRKAFKEVELKATQLAKNQLSLNLDEFYNSPCHSCEFKEDHMGRETQRREIKDQLDNLAKCIDENHLGQKTSLENKLQLLISLGYVDSQHRTTQKARIAREVQNIYVCEVITQSLLEYLSEWDIAALLSGFACQGNSKGKKSIFDNEIDLFHTNSLLMDTRERIIQVTVNTIENEIKNGVVVSSSAEEYMRDNVFNDDLMMVVYHWMVGSDFMDVCRMTKYQEGGIVRCFLRLENILRNTFNCYVILGNYVMSKKIENCLELLKKDIVFSKSLYLDQDS